MKFAKELERDLVPEWRLKYLDYKVGKKKLKAIQRALRNANQTPRFRRRGANNFTPSPFDTAPQYSFLNRDRHTTEDHSRREASGDLRALAISNSQTSLKAKTNGLRSSLSREIRRSPEEQPLNQNEDRRFPGLTRYGSIIGSPPKGRGPGSEAPPSLKLPGAALDPENVSPHVGPSTVSPATMPKSKSVQVPQSTGNENAFEVGKTRSPHHGASTMQLPSRYKSIFGPKRVNSSPGTPVTQDARPLMKRVFSLNHKSGPPSPGDVPLEAYRELDIRQSEFFQFLDMELEKIEDFYKQKEEEATERMNVLREQLHIMRDRRLDELIAHKAAKMKAKERKRTAANEHLLSGHQSSSDDDASKAKAKGLSLNASWLNPIDSALDAVRAGRYGKTTKAMTDLATPTGLGPQDPDKLLDYVRRPESPEIPYQTAKKKLKVAMQEYYRGLELLKSYALLNRTAFRKINKKYDKAVNARPSMRYMTEKVNKAWFVQSDMVEGHIRVVEDLYARYFERGNHKVAVGKLRIKTARAGDFTENSFRNGLTLAGGLVFGVQGLVYGVELLNGSDKTLGMNTSYLIQIYAGYFLMNFLFLLFSIACRVWHNSKINYVFVFEYDTRHHLDWRQLAELPCFFFFLLGLFMWLNFCRFGSETMYLYYPVVLIGLTTLILFLPLPILYFRSRQWLLYSTWRLFLAGLYPVEFRDFYLGDMFCSLTYSMGNIELFFCLYANEWGNPPMCNSSHSRLLGFFTTLPGIWRALQCVRRYYDTRNVFPHLVNCGKYTATILYYVTLSIYRLNKTEQHRAIFITFAVVNSIYCSIWDVVMDWSLGDPTAKHKFLRKHLGYKKVWMYYLAMVLDPILRFNWVLLAVIPLQLQHSAVTSFVVAISEVCRRGMWTLFRVENEHCTNVGRFRASRDVPLPYDIPSPELEARTSQPGKKHAVGTDGDTQRQSLGQLQDHIPQQSPRLHRTSTVLGVGMSDDIERQQSRSPLPRSKSSVHRRATSYTAGGPAAAPDGVVQESPFTRGLNRVGTLLRDAHAQDFERKKKPELGPQTAGASGLDDDDTDEDEDDERVGGRDSDSDDDDENEANGGGRGGEGSRRTRAGGEGQDEHDEGATAAELELEQERSRDEIREVRRDLDIGSGRVRMDAHE